MADSKDIIIIGGGIIGLACAHYLAEKGARVRIIERQKVGSGASHGNCGLLYFSDVIPLCAPGAVAHEIIRTLCRTSPLFIKPEIDIDRLLWLVRFAMKCTPSHMQRAAADKYDILEYSAGLFSSLLDPGLLQCDFHKKGILSVFRDRKNFEDFHQTNAFLKAFNLGYRPLEKREVLNLEPALKPDIAGAWYSECDQHLRPEHLVAAWKNRLLSKGVTIDEFCDVVDLTVAGKTVTQVRTSRGDYDAHAVVLATGAWSAPIAERLGFDLPVQPGKGYSITMGRPNVCPEIPCMLYERNMVVTPWHSGYRLGGTMEFSGFSSSLNRKRLNKLIEGAGEYMRSPVGEPVIEEWTSLRPMTWDDMPVIDRSPCHENLVVATGHGMLGLTLATGTGKLVADMIFGEQTEIDASPYSLKRLLR
ncbi:MAG: FAD-dependent oxidoreductase [Desulfobacterales bacterium]|nr:FAD-dependent oxidoreductase [Desulfobacterales bacterium]